jgi:hypothetical protein
MKDPHRTGHGAARVSRDITHSVPTPHVSPRQLPPPLPRLRRLAAELHSLGPRPLYECLLEIASGADPWARLERYAELAPLASFIVALGAERLPPPRIFDVGRQ